MSSQYNVLDSDMGDSILNDGGSGEVAGVQNISNVAVYKDVTGFETANGGFWDTRV
jgi:hypothetical protein